MSDLEQRFRDGVPGALAEAYEAHGSLVFSFCRRRLDAESARDVTQEVFVSAWRSHHRFDPEEGS
ncbi:MAG: RNA polymerase subunit sigma-24, partial [Acidimicrobiia bacterium]|nr:RNA polymerase subunit sigma-24 [Acidimicrobiia bacterium]